MQEHIDAFVREMDGRMCGPSNPSDIIADNVAHYYHVDGDKKGTKKGSYCLAVDGDFAYGWFVHHKDGEVHKWHAKSKRKWTPEQRAEHKRKADAARERQARERDRMAQEARDEAATIWARSNRTGSSAYLDRKGIALKGVRYDGDDLIVPMWRDGEMVAVQRILPDGSKLFLKGSDHGGAYFSIKGDQGTIAICEGVATGQTVHDATGWSVICSFVAGNLKAVAVAIRAKYPNARILIAADNDHETKKKNGEPCNVGIEKAQQAAVAIGGCQVIAPDVMTGESDWDDVRRRAGLDAVRDALMSVHTITSDDVPPDEIDTWERDDTPNDVIDDDGDANNHDPMSIIRPLGHNRGEYYFFPRTTGQIMHFSATALGRTQNLYQLAPRGFWERLYAPEESMGKIAEYASAELISACHGKGIFSIEDARGVGVWQDRGGKLLVNCGDVIVGQDVRCHPSEYDGDYVYEAGPRVIDMDIEALTSTEASKLRAICKSLSWRKPQYGDMLAGWIVIAGVGGAVNWRPHIFITGRKGSGKSTAMDKIVQGSLGSIAIKRDGGTTEAGVRKAISASSRPFIMDEAEAESAARRTQMQLIFEYFRNASSGAVVENAYASYVARSCACFGAINPRIEQGADADRWSMLELVPNAGADKEEDYKALLRSIDETIGKEFPHRLLARTVANLDVLLHNIDVFIDVFSRKLGSKRAGDQIGTLLAGAYSLTSSKRVTYDFVEDWVSKQDWEWHEMQGGGSDADALVAYIMSSRVRYDHDGMGRESTIGDMIERVVDGDGVHSDAASRGLASIGIRVDGDRIQISNTSPRLKQLLRDTAWSVYRRTLGDFDGADNCDGRVISFGVGIKSRATGIPLDAVLGIDKVDGGFIMEGFDD